MKSENRQHSSRRICFVATVEFAIVNYLLNHIRFLSLSYEITVITNTADAHALSRMLGGTRVIHIPFERKISVIKDISSLLALIHHFSRHDYDVIHSLMPKTGLIAMLAGYLCRVPVRIHTFTGQVWATKTGLKRLFLKTFDRVIAGLSSSVIADSNSQRDFIIANGVVGNDKISVIANGSICGVDTGKFHADMISRVEVRGNYTINEGDIVILYLGRMTNDKGIIDLARAFEKICSNCENVQLMFVGPDEQNMRAEIVHATSGCIDKIHFVDYTNVPEKFMNAADIFCLPSYREGFGSVIIESAAVGIPSVASRIYGIIDAIEDHVTGLLFEAKNVSDLEEKLKFLIENAGERIAMGNAAHDRVMSGFTEEIVTMAMNDYYEAVLCKPRPGV